MPVKPAPVKPVRPAPVKPAPPIKPMAGGGVPPSFDSLFVKPPNPLDGIDPADTTEEAADNEMAAIESFIKDQRKDEREQWRLMTDPDFWCCIVFQSRDQRDEFLRAVGLASLGPKYLNGLTVAHRLGVSLTPVQLPRKEVRPMPKALRAAKTIKED